MMVFIINSITTKNHPVPFYSPKWFWTHVPCPLLSIIHIPISVDQIVGKPPSAYRLATKNRCASWNGVSKISYWKSILLKSGLMLSLRYAFKLPSHPATWLSAEAAVKCISHLSALLLSRKRWHFACKASLISEGDKDIANALPFSVCDGWAKFMSSR